jgi:hypothetical protein
MSAPRPSSIRLRFRGSLQSNPAPLPRTHSDCRWNATASP